MTDITTKDRQPYTYETVENGYVIRDPDGNIMKPWILVEVLNITRKFLALNKRIDSIISPEEFELHVLQSIKKASGK